MNKKTPFLSILDWQTIVFIAFTIIALILGKYGWIDDGVVLIVVWFCLIPFNLLSFLLKGFNEANWDVKMILVCLLLFNPLLKISFTYYNVFAAVLLVVLGLWALIKTSTPYGRMKMRLSTLLAFNIFLVILPDQTLFEMKYGDHAVFWNEKLSWQDFERRESIYSDIYAATIYSDFDWDYNVVFNVPRMVSVTYMDKQRSYVDPQYTTEEGNLLHHEQIHFNITEGVRRLFEDSIEQIHNLASNDASKVYNYFQRLKDDMQDQYDEESDHGLDFGGQLIWNKRVDSLLQVTNN